MSRLIFCSLMLVFTSGLLAQPQQPPDTLWTRTYGTAIGESGRCVEPTTDGGFIIGGCNQLAYEAQLDMYVVKTDADGNVDWSFIYGDSIFSQQCLAVKQTADSGFIFTGYSVVALGGLTEKVLIIRTDVNGDTLWTRTYGGGGMVYRFRGGSVIVTPEGDYLITGSALILPGSSQIYLMKVSADGDSLWCQLYDGALATDLKITSDSSYYVIASSVFDQQYGYQVALTKVDPEGNLIWSQNYGGDSYDYGEGISLTADGGYILAGHTGSYANILLLKTDSAGNLIWMRDYGTEGYGDYGYDVITVSDGYIACGSVDTFSTVADLYVMKTDTAGNLLWDWKIGSRRYYECGYSLSLTADSGIIVCGYTFSFGTDSYDVYLVRFAPKNVGINQPIISLPEQYSFITYPNPFNAAATVSFTLPLASEVKLIIYDTAGQQIVKLIDGQQSRGHHRIQFDASQLSSGLYFVFLAAGNYQASQKLLLVK